MSSSPETCEVCGAPTQAVRVPLDLTYDGPEAFSVLIAHCSSLLCPTNLSVSPASERQENLGDPEMPAARRA